VNQKLAPFAKFAVKNLPHPLRISEQKTPPKRQKGAYIRNPNPRGSQYEKIPDIRT